MAVPTCPHCKVPMKKYEEVKKDGLAYGRFKCPTQVCPDCRGKNCTETRGEFID